MLTMEVIKTKKRPSTYSVTPPPHGLVSAVLILALTIGSAPKAARTHLLTTAVEPSREGNQGLQLSMKERTPSSTSSSGLITPATRSRRTSIDIAAISRMLGSGRDEVDFGYEAIPEDQPTVEASSRLVKVLDLSSNQISSLSELVEKGDTVLWRLRGLERLDLKQNNLCQLPANMMKV